MKAHDLKNLRNRVDILDKQLLFALLKRFGVVTKIGEYKKKHNLKAWDKKREKEMRIQCLKFAQKNGLSGRFVTSIFSLIWKESRQRQQNVIKG